LVLFLTPLQSVYLFCNQSRCILLFFSRTSNDITKHSICTYMQWCHYMILVKHASLADGNSTRLLSEHAYKNNSLLEESHIISIIHVGDHRNNMRSTVAYIIHKTSSFIED
jgi:hypothetical protein